MAARLQELVAERGLRPGDRLPSERELMAEFGVGRSFVREATLTFWCAGAVAVSSGERARCCASCRAWPGACWPGPAALRS